jgi:hypothetical protein
MIFSSDRRKNPARREVLAGLGAAGAVALLARRGVQAQTAPLAFTPLTPQAIDCHHHFVSPAWIKAMAAKENKKLAGYTTWFALPQLRPYTTAKDLEDMDRAGVAASMLSCTTPGIWFGDPEETKALARDMNDFGAKAVSDHKQRFGLFALLPLPAIDDSLKEIAYAFDTLKADGVGLLSSYGNHWLGDPIFRPVMDELNRRNAVVYVHPTDAPCCQELIAGAQPGAVEYNKHGHGAHHFQPAVHQRGDALRQYQIHFFAWRRDHAVTGRTVRHRPAGHHQSKPAQRGGTEFAAVPLAAVLLRHGSVHQRRADDGIANHRRCGPDRVWNRLPVRFVREAHRGIARLRVQLAGFGWCVPKERITSVSEIGNVINEETEDRIRGRPA